MAEITLDDVLTLKNVTIYNKENFSNIQNILVHISNGDVALSELKDDYPLYMDISGTFDLDTFNKIFYDSKLPILLVSEEDYPTIKEINTTIIVTSDINKTYGELAKIWRKKLPTKFISITGSTGKTSTKEMLFCLLNEKYDTHKTFKNSNNDMGVPFSVLLTKEHHQYCIIEHGTNHFGEIGYTADIVNPDYSLITNIGSSHTEFLINKMGVFNEKNSLFKKTNKTVFINNEDYIIRENTKHIKNKFTFGFHHTSDIMGTIIDCDDKGRYKFKLVYKNMTLEIRCLKPGLAFMKNLFAAISIGLYFKLTPDEIENGIKKIEFLDKRTNFLELKKFTIIDDTYSSSPESMDVALDLISKIKHDNKILILGDMLELGDTKIKDHVNLSTKILKSNIKCVITIGNLMLHLHKQLKHSNIQKNHYNTVDEFIHSINIKDYENRLILVKGSRILKMDRIVQSLINISL